ncbi:hypothetical protein [Nocardia sp. CDC160]|uniref:hypothetical protein n=1 Tax=Nocardia sp. CDC160 TaxID=3112166 RepID=UPI002DBFE0FF|nr:hypothetical protein [Nocardia sp. CDC160]MEC3913316.1 hypothetical protein [Nocardia sp. CDC160]
MTIVSWQWPLVFALVLIRLLAPGWLIMLTLWTLGLPAFIVCAPLLFAASLSTPDQHPLIRLADLLLLTAAFTVPDGGDNSGYHIPLLTLLKGNPEIDEKNLLGRALVWTGTASALAYAAILLILWAKIAEAHGWITLGFT